MASRRQERVERELRECIAAFLIRGFKPSLPGLISVTRVSASPDLRQARVYFSLLGADERIDQVEDLLNEQADQVQAQIHRELRPRFTPKLRFFFDQGLEKALEVESTLRDLAKERQTREGANSSEEGEPSS